MVNYQNGKVYLIRCHTTNQVYIGCTTKVLLCSRLAEHVTHFRHYMGSTGYCASFIVLKGGNYTIELLENVPCTSRNELTTRELYFIKSMECVNIAGKKKYSTKKKKSPSEIEADNKINQQKQIAYRNWKRTNQPKQKLMPYYKCSAELRKIDLL